MVKALVRAFHYQRMLDEGRYASITEMAAAERLERGYLGSLLRLTLLAPDIVETILDGWRPKGVDLSRTHPAKAAGQCCSGGRGQLRLGFLPVPRQQLMQL